MSSPFQEPLLEWWEGGEGEGQSFEEDMSRRVARSQDRGRREGARRHLYSEGQATELRGGSKHVPTDFVLHHVGLEQGGGGREDETQRTAPEQDGVCML